MDEISSAVIDKGVRKVCISYRTLKNGRHYGYCVCYPGERFEIVLNLMAVAEFLVTGVFT